MICVLVVKQAVRTAAPLHVGAAVIVARWPNLDAAQLKTGPVINATCGAPAFSYHYTVSLVQ
jgi:hypothetical protein